jgi:hypothetical protein
MEFLLIACIAAIAAFLFEYRLRKPDEIIIREIRDGVGIRRGRWYPRHTSLPISRSTFSFTQTIDASAKGNVELRVRLAVTVAPSLKDLSALIRGGGWRTDALMRTSKELETLLLGFVKSYTERHELEEVSSETVREYLLAHTNATKQALGLEIIAMTVSSLEPVNTQIAEAMRQREHARILEQSETLSQHARIATAKTRIKADEEIAMLENELELKKFDLKRVQLEKESALAAERAAHEIHLKKLQLEVEKEELQILKDHPELLLLTPQAARLAEASQSLKNARTVVSFAPSESGQGGDLIGVLQSILQNALDAVKRKNEK